MTNILFHIARTWLVFSSRDRTSRIYYQLFCLCQCNTRNQIWAHISRFVHNQMSQLGRCCSLFHRNNHNSVDLGSNRYEIYEIQNDLSSFSLQISSHIIWVELDWITCNVYWLLGQDALLQDHIWVMAWVLFLKSTRIILKSVKFCSGIINFREVERKTNRRLLCNG